MSGVRAGRCWGGGEDGEDGRDGESWGKERERERVVDSGERSGAFPRTVGPRCGVGCPALISARSRSGFSSNPVLPKPQSRGGWIKRETFVFFLFFFHLVVIKNLKKQGPHIPSAGNSFLFSLFFPIKRDKQRMIHRFHTGVRF